MDKFISRRMILSLLPIQTNKKSKKAYVIQPAIQPTIYVSDRNKKKMTLQKNSTFTLHLDTTNGTFDGIIIIENNNDQFITKKEIIKWYDPFTDEIIEKRENISYILGGEES